MVPCSKGWQFWPNKRFFLFFHEMRHFLLLFSKKFMETPKYRSFFQKLRVFVNSIIFRVFSRNEAPFLQLFAQNIVKTPKRCDLLKKLRVFAKSTSFRVLSRNEALFATFCWKIHGKAETWYFVRKVDSFFEIDDFSCFVTKWDTCCNFPLKTSWKCRNVVVCSKSWEFLRNRWFFVFCHEMRHLLQLSAEKFIKTPKRGSLFERFTVLVKSMISRDFSRHEARFATFCSKVCQNAEAWWFVPKVPRSCQIDDISCFLTKWGIFRKFLRKSSLKTPNHGRLFEKLRVLARWTTFRVFPRNKALFASFC